MSSFTRYAAVAVVVLSLGFLVASAPLTINANIPACTGKDAVSLVMAKLCADIEVHFKALLACGTVAELKVLFEACIDALQVCADGFLKIGAGVVVDVNAQANIATCMAAIITLYVQISLHLIAKFGIKVVLDLCTGIDVVLHLCLVNLNLCIGGIFGLILKALVSVTAGLMAQVNLKLCSEVLGLAL